MKEQLPKTEPQCNCQTHTEAVKNVTFHRWDCLFLVWSYYHSPIGRIETVTSEVKE